MEKIFDKKLLVIGPPRSGFTLLINVLTNIIRYSGYRFKQTEKRSFLKNFVPLAGHFLYSELEHFFKKYIDLSKLVLSPEFKLLVGGPKWVNGDMAYIRKYIGIEDEGCFLLVFIFPKQILDYYEVIHSHYNPIFWLNDNYYKSYLKFASIRNPLDILNSSVFSINAMTGAYIFKHNLSDIDKIREQLGLYKLTDLNVFEGLALWLKEYLKEFLKVKNNYFVMRWEDLITEPAKTIRKLASIIGLSISENMALEIWDKMKYRNLTRWHVLNFRKGIIGDWKNHLTNFHIEILKDLGYDVLCKELGYGSLYYLKVSEYTDFQKYIEECIKKKKIYNNIEDKNIFIFGFNQTNIKTEKFGFKSFSMKDYHLYIEKTTIDNEIFFKKLLETLEPIVEKIGAHLLNKLTLLS